MSGRVRAWTIVAAVVLAAPASGQSVGWDITSGPDTLFAIPIGRTLTADLYATGQCATSYTITLLFDDTRVHVVDADSVLGQGLPSPSITSGPGFVTLTASGGTGCPSYLARVFFEMDAGATEGTLLTLRVDAMLNSVGTNIRDTQRTAVLPICQAVRMWGDLDSTFTVSSRDALIALTAAVGLPLPNGYMPSVGDVDADGYVTTRDALFILGHGIGFETGDRPGHGVPNRCDPLAPAPRDMAFYTTENFGFRVLQGDTLRVAFGQWFGFEPTLSWAPDASTIAVETGVAGFASEPVLWRLGTTRVDTMFLSASADVRNSWSPDGTRIAVASNRVATLSIFIHDADGAAPVRVTTTHTILDIAWSPDGTRFAFTGYTVCCTPRLFTVNVDGTGLVEVFANSNLHFPGRPVWSPASDSITYVHQNLGRIYKAQATGGGTGIAISQIWGSQDMPAWGPSGIAFVSNPGTFSFQLEEVYLLRNSDGRHLRLTRTSQGRASRPTFRTPTVYVSTVQIAGNATLDIELDPTEQFAATVTNSDASTNGTVPLRWISRNPAVFTVDGTGLAQAQSEGSAYLVVSVRGWRADSALVTVTNVPGPAEAVRQ